MIIFEQEKLDGIEHLVSSSASIKLSSLAEPLSVNEKPPALPKAIASYDDNDLYYIQSILVSSSWNKNDDIFDKKEIWLAKSTPEDKPTNLEHDESVIVGHITANWPITEDGQMIDQNISIDQLPDKYHILTGSVIYKGYSNSELRSRAEKLIEEIENGTKYVSMECFFKGFDYGILDKSTGEYKILARNNDTAYLTKHLRAYGGQGEKDNYKIGRVLRSITFTGKGFVDKPANADSVIFTKESFLSNSFKENYTEDTKKTNEFLFSGVSNKQSQLYSEANDMSNVVETQNNSPCDEIISKASSLMDKVSELTEQNLNLTSQIDTLNKEHEVAMSQMQETNSVELVKAEQALNERIAHLEAEVQKYIELEAEAAKKMKDMEEEKKMMKDKEEKMQADIVSANEVIAAYKSKEEEMMKKEKKMKRQAALIECGIDNDTAASVLEKFESLDDEAFDTMAAVFATLKPATVAADVASSTEAEEAPTVTEQVLENVEIDEEVNLGVGSEAVTEDNSTRAALVEFVRSRLSKK